MAKTSNKTSNKSNTQIATVTDMAAVREARKGKKPVSAQRQAAMEVYKQAKEGDNEQATKAALQSLRILKFKELAPVRVRKALKVLGQVENLANRVQYSWEDAEAQKIISALQSAVDAIGTKLTSVAAKKEKELFSL